MDLQSALEMTAAAGAAAGGLFGLWKLVAKRARPFFRALASFHLIPAQLAAIKHELEPNGGGSMRDEVRRIGRDIRLHGATLRAYVENSNEGIFEADGQGLYIYSNGTYLRWTERAPSECLGFGWLSCIAETDRDDVRQEWIAAVEEKREFKMRYAMVTASGQEFSVDCLAKPIRDVGSSEVSGWVGHIRKRYPTGQQAAVRIDEE
ncbi:MAG: PAS domain-containing protein [Pseudomonadota bacterium]|nr:PAS domain-containing protein [Pseudomonadota bacterium]